MALREIELSSVSNFGGEDLTHRTSLALRTWPACFRLSNLNPCDTSNTLSLRLSRWKNLLHTYTSCTYSGDNMFLKGSCHNQSLFVKSINTISIVYYIWRTASFHRTPYPFTPLPSSSPTSTRPEWWLSSASLHHTLVVATTISAHLPCGC